MKLGHMDVVHAGPARRFEFRLIERVRETALRFGKDMGLVADGQVLGGGQRQELTTGVA